MGGERVDRTTLRAHQRVCEWRPVNDCPCRSTFLFKDREAHEAQCLPAMQLKLPVLLKERDAARAALTALSGELRDQRLEAAEKQVDAASGQAAALLLSLALLSIVGQAVRPDASLAVALAIVTLAAAHLVPLATLAAALGLYRLPPLPLPRRR